MKNISEKYIRLGGVFGRLGLALTCMTRGSFGALHLAAARPEISKFSSRTLFCCVVPLVLATIAAAL